MGETRGRVVQGTCMKDPWTKPKGGWIEGGRWGWWGWGQWRQLYLNDNYKNKKIINRHLNIDILSFLFSTFNWNLSIK